VFDYKNLLVIEVMFDLKLKKFWFWVIWDLETRKWASALP